MCGYRMHAGKRPAADAVVVVVATRLLESLSRTLSLFNAITMTFDLRINPPRLLTCNSESFHLCLGCLI